MVCNLSVVDELIKSAEVWKYKTNGFAMMSSLIMANAVRYLLATSDLHRVRVIIVFCMNGIDSKEVCAGLVPGRGEGLMGLPRDNRMRYADIKRDKANKE